MSVKIEEFLKLREVGVAVDSVLEEARILKQRINLAKKHFGCGDFQEGAKLIGFFFSHLNLLDGTVERLQTTSGQMAKMITTMGVEVVRERVPIVEVDDLPALSELVSAEENGGQIGRARTDIRKETRPRESQPQAEDRSDGVPGKSRIRRLLGL